ncbi:MAG: glycoside hydrolase family 32 protein [Eubacteriales bacterium]|nr:glycoside hydrolase family 32 protein [Eubacteriales bacterium]
MGDIYTEDYECLEIFAKATEGKRGSVSVTDRSGNRREYPAGEHQYRLLRIPVQKETAYDVALSECAVSICYLSETENILDRGVLFLEWKQGAWEKTKDLAQWYQTPGREQYHFAPYKNWLNDPNGLCWYQGYYHMYYQANPHAQEWSHMYWGHAASRDCVHWVHLPYVLEPQEEILEAADKKGGAFSGSAAVLDDRIRFYLTRHFGPPEDSEQETVQYQTMVESRDSIHFGEETLIIEKPNADFSYNFRDPKVVWHDGCWQMVIGTRVGEVPSVALYQSEDGKSWTYKGILLQEKTEGVYTFECPDLFFLAGKAVITGAWMFYSDEHRRFQPTYYYIGSFQNGEFALEKKGLYDFAGNFYAVQSFEHEGRRIAIGWISDFYNEHCPEENGAYGSMAIPRELYVKDGVLCQRPIAEIYRQKGKCYCDIKGQNVSLKHLNRNSYYAKLLFDGDTNFEILLGKSRDAEIRLVRRDGELLLTTQGVRSHFVTCVTRLEKLTKLEIFVDRRTVEIFANDGERAGSKLFYPEKGGVFQAKFDYEEHVNSIEICEMKGIWG